MAIIATQSKVHWTYFVALEKDLEVVTRYIEFADANMETFSLELAHLLMAASSEVDVVAKLLCERLSPGSAPRNIDQYRQILTGHIPDLASMPIFIPRYGLNLTPWASWRGDINPEWWRSYNNVKHERNAYFHEATLKNSLNALAALLCLTFHLYQLDVSEEPRRDRAKETTATLQPDSTLMRLQEGYYYENLWVG